MAVTLTQAVRLASERGQPLPHIDWLAPLYAGGNEIYRGSLAVFAGVPGARKTQFALAFVESLGLPALYFSADSDEGVIAPRVLAFRTGYKAKQIRKDLHDSPAAREFYGEETSSVEYVFDPSPSIGEIQDEVSAWVERYDSFPEVIVIDNLLDVYSDFDSEHQGFKAVLKEFKTLARLTNAAVIVAHHNREEDGKDAGKPLGRKSMHGRPTQTPALVLSLAIEGFDNFHVAVVKDRNGPSSPDADTYFTILSDPEVNRFSELKSLQRVTNDAWSPTAALEA